MHRILGSAFSNPAKSWRVPNCLCKSRRRLHHLSHICHGPREKSARYDQCILGSCSSIYTSLSPHPQDSERGRPPARLAECIAYPRSRLGDADCRFVARYHFWHRLVLRLPPPGFIIRKTGHTRILTRTRPYGLQGRLNQQRLEDVREHCSSSKRAL